MNPPKADGLAHAGRIGHQYAHPPAGERLPRQRKVDFLARLEPGVEEDDGRPRLPRILGMNQICRESFLSLEGNLHPLGPGPISKGKVTIEAVDALFIHRLRFGGFRKIHPLGVLVVGIGSVKITRSRERTAAPTLGQRHRPQAVPHPRPLAEPQAAVPHLFRQAAADLEYLGRLRRPRRNP